MIIDIISIKQNDLQQVKRENASAYNIKNIDEAFKIFEKATQHPECLNVTATMYYGPNPSILRAQVRIARLRELAIWDQSLNGVYLLSSFPELKGIKLMEYTKK